MIAFQPCAGFQAAGIGTGLRFGQCKSAEHGAAGQRFEKAFTLIVVTELENRHAAD
ncbi:hypothetical protein D3C72_2060090 [compost metagenome]